MCIRMCIHVCVRVLPGILIDLYAGCMIQILNSFKRWVHNAGEEISTWAYLRKLRVCVTSMCICADMI